MSGWRWHRETCELQLLVHVDDSFLFQLELNPHHLCSHTPHLRSNLPPCVKESCPSNGKRWIVRQCETGRSWYVCISLADVTIFDWTLLDVQSGSSVRNLGWSGYGWVSGWTGCSIWITQRGSIDHIMEIVMGYNVLPYSNCLDVLSMDSWYHDTRERISPLAWNEDFSVSGIELVPV